MPKLSKMIKELGAIMEEHGDIDVNLQSPSVGGLISDLKAADAYEKDDTCQFMTYEDIFMVVEPYDEGPILNIRNWPY